MFFIINLIKYRFFTKIHDDYITFISFNGKYSDGPRALTEEIHNIDKTKTLIWLVNDIDNDDIPGYVRRIKYGSKEAWDYYCKSKIIIDNVYCMHEYYQEGKSFIAKIKYKLVSFLKNKKGQIFYTTWHGNPIKKIGSDSIGSNIVNFSCPNTVMFIDCKYTANIQRRITCNEVKTELFGSPRNDILFCNSNKKSDLKKKLKLPKNKKIILYAPTFRSFNNVQDVNRSGLLQLSEIDFNLLFQTLSDKFGSDWVFVGRFHYHVEKIVNWRDLEEKYGNRIINGNFGEDMSEYLACTDILLTDVSSCMFDFMITKRPVFLFFPDYDYYVKKERGLYYSVNDLPFPFSQSFPDLIDSIKDFNKTNYLARVEKTIDKYGFITDVNSSKKVAKRIMEGIDFYEHDNK